MLLSLTYISKTENITRNELLTLETMIELPLSKELIGVVDCVTFNVRPRGDSTILGLFYDISWKEEESFLLFWKTEKAWFLVFWETVKAWLEAWLIGVKEIVSFIVGWITNQPIILILVWLVISIVNWFWHGW